MKRYIYILTAVLAAGAVLASCSKYDDSALVDSIDELDSRVSNMETVVLAMQSNLDAIQEIADRLESSATVDSVEPTADGWTITFSDGTSVTLSDGVDGQPGADGQPGYNPPRIVIVEDGGTYYWAYDNGEFILNDGERIPASNIAPQLRLSDEGEWEVSVDGGLTWQPTGTVVFGGQSAFIADVYDDELNYYIELQSGYVITLPKTTAGLRFVFLGSDGSEISSLAFTAGETKTLSYTMTQSEATLSFTKPDGWKASVEGDVLSISAPDTAVNKYAELSGPLSAILTLADGRIFVSTLSVSIGEGEEPGGDEPEPQPAPAVGDYYYSDNTWSTDLNEDKTVVGVVFWAGDATAYDPGLKADHPECVNGLAVAIDENYGAWQAGTVNFNTMVSDWLTNNGHTDCTPLYIDVKDEAQRNSRLGYSQTESMKVYNDDVTTEYKLDIMQYVEDYRAEVVAPEGSSDWFVPSLKELTILFCGADVDPDEFTKNGSVKTTVNTSLTGINATTLSARQYYTSCETGAQKSYTVELAYGEYDDVYKDYENNIRLIIAF